MLVSIHRGLVYLKFKLQWVVVEVKQVAFFIFHRQCYSIHIIVAAVRFTKNMWLWCFGSEPFQRVYLEHRIAPKLLKVFH